MRCIPLVVVSMVTACGGQSLKRTPVTLAASTDSLDFGSVLMGQTEELLVTLSNTGDKALTVDEVTGDNLGGVFTTQLDGARIELTESVLLRVGFSPAHEGPYATVFVVHNSSQNQPELEITVDGIGVDPGPCAGVDCSTPPDAVCLTSTRARVYLPNGTCDNGQCIHETSEEDCDFGCSNGACNPDPCIGVSCVTPPNDECYSNTGSCTMGVCDYTPLPPETACDSGDLCVPDAECNDAGDCLGTRRECIPPMQTCTNQPDSSGLIERYDQSVGFCDSATGGCEFSRLSDIVCEYGCAGDTCSGDPCIGTPCDDGTPCTIDECVPGGGTYSCSYTLATLPDNITGISCTIGSGQCNQGQCQINGSGTGTYALCMPVDGAACTDDWNPSDTPAFCTLADAPGTCVAAECIKDQAFMNEIINTQCDGCVLCQECPSNGVNGEPWICL